MARRADFLAHINIECFTQGVQEASAELKEISTLYDALQKKDKTTLQVDDRLIKAVNQRIKDANQEKNVVTASTPVYKLTRDIEDPDIRVQKVKEAEKKRQNIRSKTATDNAKLFNSFLDNRTDKEVDSVNAALDFIYDQVRAMYDIKEQTERLNKLDLSNPKNASTASRLKNSINFNKDSLDHGNDKTLVALSDAFMDTFMMNEEEFFKFVLDRNENFAGRVERNKARLKKEGKSNAEVEEAVNQQKEGFIQEFVKYHSKNYAKLNNGKDGNFDFLGAEYEFIRGASKTQPKGSANKFDILDLLNDFYASDGVQQNQKKFEDKFVAAMQKMGFDTSEIEQYIPKLFKTSDKYKKAQEDVAKQNTQVAEEKATKAKEEQAAAKKATKIVESEDHTSGKKESTKPVKKTVDGQSDTLSPVVKPAASDKPEAGITKNGQPINFDVEADFSEILSKIEEIKHELSDIPISFDLSGVTELQNAVNKIKESFENIGGDDSFSGLSKAIENMKSSMIELKSAAEGIQNIVSGETAKTDEDKSSSKKKKDSKKESEAGSDIGVQAKAINSDIDSLYSKISELKKHLSDISISFDLAGISDLNSEIEKLETSLSELGSKLDFSKTETQFNAIGSSIKDLHDLIRDFNVDEISSVDQGKEPVAFDDFVDSDAVRKNKELRKSIVEEQFNTGNPAFDIPNKDFYRSVYDEEFTPDNEIKINVLSSNVEETVTSLKELDKILTSLPDGQIVISADSRLLDNIQQISKNHNSAGKDFQVLPREIWDNNYQREIDSGFENHNWEKVIRDTKYSNKNIYSDIIRRNSAMRYARWDNFVEENDLEVLQDSAFSYLASAVDKLKSSKTFKKNGGKIDSSLFGPEDLKSFAALSDVLVNTFSGTDEDLAKYAMRFSFDTSKKMSMASSDRSRSAVSNKFVEAFKQLRQNGLAEFDGATVKDELDFLRNSPIDFNSDHSSKSLLSSLSEFASTDDYLESLAAQWGSIYDRRLVDKSARFAYSNFPVVSKDYDNSIFSQKKEAPVSPPLQEQANVSGLDAISAKIDEIRTKLTNIPISFEEAPIQNLLESVDKIESTFKSLSAENSFSGLTTVIENIQSVLADLKGTMETINFDHLNQFAQPDSDKAIETVKPEETKVDTSVDLSKSRQELEALKNELDSLKKEIADIPINFDLESVNKLQASLTELKAEFNSISELPFAANFSESVVKATGEIEKLVSSLKELDFGGTASGEKGLETPKLDVNGIGTNLTTKLNESFENIKLSFDLASLKSVLTEVRTQFDDIPITFDTSQLDTIYARFAEIEGLLEDLNLGNLATDFSKIASQVSRASTQFNNVAKQIGLNEYPEFNFPAGEQSDDGVSSSRLDVLSTALKGFDNSIKLMTSKFEGVVTNLNEAVGKISASLDAEAEAQVKAAQMMKDAANPENQREDPTVTAIKGFGDTFKAALDGIASEFKEAVSQFKSATSELDFQGLGAFVEQVQQALAYNKSLTPSITKRKSPSSLSDEKSLTGEQTEAARNKIYDAFGKNSKYNASSVAVMPDRTAYMTIDWVNERNELVSYEAEINDYRNLLKETGDLEESIVNRSITNFVGAKPKPIDHEAINSALLKAADKTGLSIDEKSIQTTEDGITSFTATLTQSNGVVETYRLSVKNLLNELANAKEGNSSVFTEKGSFRKKDYLDANTPEIDDTKEFRAILKNGVPGLLDSIQGKSKVPIQDAVLDIASKMVKQNEDPEQYKQQLLKAAETLQSAFKDTGEGSFKAIQDAFSSLLDTLGVRKSEQDQTIQEVLAMVQSRISAINEDTSAINASTKNIKDAVGTPSDKQKNIIDVANTLFDEIQGNNDESLKELVERLVANSAKQTEDPKGYKESLMSSAKLIQDAFKGTDEGIFKSLEDVFNSLLDTVGIRESEKQETMHQLMSMATDRLHKIASDAEGINVNTSDIKAAIGTPEDGALNLVNGINKQIEQLSAMQESGASEATLKAALEQLQASSAKLTANLKDPNAFANVFEKEIPAMLDSLSAFDAETGQETSISGFLAKLKTITARIETRGKSDAETLKIISEELAKFKDSQNEAAKAQNESLEAIATAVEPYGGETSEDIKYLAKHLADKIRKQEERNRKQAEAENKSLEQVIDENELASKKDVKSLGSGASKLVKQMDKIMPDQLSPEMADLIQSRLREPLSQLGINLSDSVDFDDTLKKIEDFRTKLISLTDDINNKITKGGLTNKEVADYAHQITAATNAVDQLKSPIFKTNKGSKALVAGKLVDAEGNRITASSIQNDPESLRKAISQQLQTKGLSLLNINNVSEKDNALTLALKVKDEATGTIKSVSALLDSYIDKEGKASTALRVDNKAFFNADRGLLGKSNTNIAGQIEQLLPSQYSEEMGQMLLGNIKEPLQRFGIEIADDLGFEEVIAKLESFKEQVLAITTDIKEKLANGSMADSEVIDSLGKLNAASDALSVLSESKYLKKFKGKELISGKLLDSAGKALDLGKVDKDSPELSDAISKAISSRGLSLQGISGFETKGNVATLTLSVKDDVSNKIQDIKASLEACVDSANQVNTALRLDSTGLEKLSASSGVDDITRYYNNLIQKFKTGKEIDSADTVKEKLAAKAEELGVDLNDTKYRNKFDPEKDVARSVSLSKSLQSSLTSQMNEINNILSGTQYRGIAQGLYGDLAAEINNLIDRSPELSKLKIKIDPEVDSGQFLGDLDKIISQVRDRVNELSESFEKGFFHESVAEDAKKELAQLQELLVLPTSNKFQEFANGKKFLGNIPLSEMTTDEDYLKRVKKLQYEQGRIIESMSAPTEKNGVTSVDIVARKFGSNDLERLSVGFGKVKNAAGEATIQAREFTRALVPQKSPAEELYDSYKMKINQLMVYLSSMDIARYLWRGIKSGFNFNTELDSLMTTIQQTTSISKEGIADLSQGAIDQAKELGVTVDKVTGAIDVYASMGETTESLLSKSAPTTMMAKAAGMEISTASDVIQGVKSGASNK